jgi:hypothetical protein
MSNTLQRYRLAQQQAACSLDAIRWTHEWDCSLCGVPVLQIQFENGRRVLEPIYPPDPLQPGEKPCQHRVGRKHKRKAA